MNNITTVDELISEYSTDKKDDYSVFVYNDDEIKISNKKVISFLKQYSELNYSELIEQVNEFSQLCIIGEYEQGKRMNESRHQILELVHEVQSIMKEEHDIEENNRSLTCFIFELKSIFRLQFPFFELTLNGQEELINQLKTEFNILSSQYRCLLRTQNSKLKYIINPNGEPHKSLRLSEFFEVPFPEENEELDSEEIIKKYISIIFSSHYDEEAVWNDFPEEENDEENEEENESTDQDLDKYDISLQLIDMIIQRTFNNDDELKDIIRAVRFSCNNSRKGFESLKTKLIEHGIFELKEKLLKKIYFDDDDKMIKKTFRTLAFYAKRDDEVRYKMWHRNWVNLTIEAAIYCHDYDIAKLLYKINWTDFVFTGEDWYQFQDGKWLNVKKKAIELRKKISDIIPMIEKFKAKLTGKLSKDAEKNESTRNQLNDLLKRCMALSSKVKSRSGRDSIVILSGEMFYERGFIDFLDVNPFTLGIPHGGVIELTTKEAKFRSCRPDDYVSITTLVDYDSKLTERSEPVRECMKWFKQVLVDPGLIEYFLLFSASILRGQNIDKNFVSFIGNGNNSKSMFKKLYEAVLGKGYCWTLPKGFLVANNKLYSNNTTELNGAEKARLVFAQEPKRKEKIDSSLIKELTGDDSIHIRKLYEEAYTSIIMFKMVYMSNKAIQLEEYDAAIKRRMVFIDFKSVWTKDAPESPKEQFEKRTFKEDPNFSTKIPKMAKGMLWLMVKYYKLYCEKGLVLPKCLQEFNDNYWKDNDMLVDFIETCLVKTDLTDDKIKVSTMYEVFRVWYTETSGNHVPSMEFFKSEMICKLGSTNRNNWLKCRFSEEGVIYAETFDINI
jgi:P4 family phage/plasmid primase-like protien